MEINNFSIFNTDNKCYRPKSSLMNTDKLNEYILDNFTTYNFDIKNNSGSENINLVEECKNMALRENKSLFITTDLTRYNKGNDFKYKCLIPKTNKSCEFDNIENLLKPFNDLINDLFGDKSQRTSSPIENEVTLNDQLRNTDLRNISNCISFGKNNNFSKSNNFIIYKTELIDNENLIRNLPQIKSYNHYKNLYDNWNTSTPGILSDLTDAIIRYICENTQNQENNLDIKIKALTDHYLVIINSLDSISYDISNVAFITQYETLYLEKLQKMIDDKKEELKSLIGFDGANNGKLGDTLFLKNLKISENVILFLIITFIIYVYAKKQI
tara:strand:- start:314 stop:1297 length:984 start_codon:yes stop_codon:yes gene_type:complete